MGRMREEENTETEPTDDKGSVGDDVKRSEDVSSASDGPEQRKKRQGPFVFTFKRPALLWAFSLYFLYSTVFEISRTYGIWAGNFGPEPQAAYDGLTWVDWAMWGTLITLTLTATTTMFFLKRIAVPLFVTVLAVNIITLLYQLSAGTGIGSGENSAVGVVMGFGIYIMVCVYAFSLRVTGVLK